MTSFDIDVNALLPTRVLTASTGRSDRSDNANDVQSTDVESRGETSVVDVSSSEVPESILFLGSGAVSGQRELEVRAQAIYDQQQWYITGSGDVDGNFYGHVIRPHKMITIRGISENYSGEYYVTHVTHQFKSGGYSMQIKTKRNATNPSGREDFSTDDNSALSVG